MENIQQVIKQINEGAVGILPTDTIYGVVAAVRYPKSLQRIYHVKGRSFQKKLIMLVSNIDQLSELGISINEQQAASLKKIWPAPISIEFECPNDDKEYIHRGTKCVAVRMPDLPWLRQLIDSTGPIVATSANLSGKPTPSSIDEIKAQLPGLDFYVEGPVGNTPSRLIRLNDDGSTEELAR